MSESGSPPGRFGGSIEQTLAGAARLEVSAVLREAWQASHAIRPLVVPGMVLVTVAVVLASLALAAVFGVEDRSVFGATVSQLVTMIIVYPYMAGAFLLALRHSAGLSVAFPDQFACYRNWLPLVAVGLLQNVVTSLGFMLLIVPGIYLSFALYLAVPLKAERDLPITECLVISLRLVNRKLFEVSVLVLLSGVMTIVGVFTLVGWIWTMPWALMILAIVYRQLAGFAPARPVVAVDF